MSLMRSRNVERPEPERSYLELLLSSIPQGRATVISYIRQLSIEDEKYKLLITEYDKHKRSDLGKLCESLNILPADLLADVNRAAYPVLEEASNLSRGIAQGIVARRLPKVVERGLIEGGKADGIADRHFTLQKEGFHVAPKGVQISMNQLNANTAGLSSFEDETKSLSDILTTDGEILELEAGDTEYLNEEDEIELVKERVA